MRTEATYEFLLLTAVCYADVGLAALVEDSEGEVLDVGLHLGIIEFTADETLRIEDSVVGVHGNLILRGITNETLGVGERDIRGGRAVTLVVRNDFDTVVLPDTDARVRGTQVNADRF